MDEVFLKASEYIAILKVPLFCITVPALAHALVSLLRYAVFSYRAYYTDDYE